MGFDRVLKSDPNRAQATLSVRWFRSVISCAATVRVSLAAKAGMSAGDHVNVYVGSGEDADRLRICVEPGGEFVLQKMRGETLCVRFAAPKWLGDEMRARTPAAACVISCGVELTWPWSAGRPVPRASTGVSPPTPDPSPPHAGGGGPPAAKPSGLKKTGAKTAAAGPPAPVAHHAEGDLRFDLTSGHERIWLASEPGAIIDVSARGAKLVQMLAKVKGQPVDEGFIVSRLWPVKPSGVTTHLDMVLADLAVLKRLNLAIARVRGVGFKLVDIEWRAA